jgi:exodeoxyribonuclease VII large subunit
LGQLRQRIGGAASRVVERRRSRIEGLAGQLHALSPLQTLGRGFSVARAADGATLSSVAQFAPGRPFDLWVQDGIIAAEARSSRPLPDGVGAGSPEEVA